MGPFPGGTHADKLPRVVVLACGSQGAWCASSCPHARQSGLELELPGRLTLPDPPAPTGRTNQKEKCCVDMSAWQGGRRGQRGQGGSASMLGTGPCHPTSAPGGGDRAGPSAHHPRAQNRPETPAGVSAPSRHREAHVGHRNTAVALTPEQGTVTVLGPGRESGLGLAQCVQCSLSAKCVQSTCSATELHPPQR